ncbi:lysozyme [Solirubrobacter ginsenosidimutans]|uniref:Lysozyme n=1 Tax=Solirubrobacter ginsenosidimutans TaxID=490573 RepID=A0A9X3MZE9_9ACTN|nr:lysozyme [Solirubrobacter ginsenosidimutans]MDA0165831.1 lysozyme [Solirubrobacter ginsenosidimutans]
MKTSQHGIEFIASFEGFIDHPYQDAVGVWTIGYGHTGPGTRGMGKISRTRGMELLAADVGIAEGAVNALRLQLTQGQFDALVSIAFNCGGGILAATRSLGQALRQPGMAGVPAAFRLYTHAGPRELPGLVRRREEEAKMWGTAQPAGPAAWLTPSELQRCRELDRLRKVEHPDPGQQRQIAELVGTLTTQRKRIWRSAQARPRGDGHGWDYRNRRQRYESLRSRTTA